MTNSQYIVVVGCGRLGSILANRLSSEGHSVVVIDQNENHFSKLSTAFSGFRIVGDAVESAVLKRAKTDKADCFFAVTDQDNINLMVAQIAKEIFQVPKVLARVYDPAREQGYQDLDISTISPTLLSAQAFLDILQPSQVVQA